MTEKRVEVEIAGYKGHIDTVTGQVANSRPYPLQEDRLMVVIGFDEAVDGILAFPIYLPAKLYEKDEFLGAVKQEGGKALTDMLRRDREERAKTALREEKQRVLNHIAWGVKKAIGLE